MSYNSNYVRNICEIFASMGVFGVGPSKAANQILPQPTFLATTKFGEGSLVNIISSEVFRNFLTLPAIKATAFTYLFQ